MKGKRRVVVVGSGLAGLAAADVLCRSGCDVVIVDDGLQAGGQYLKRPGALSKAPSGSWSSLKALGFSLINRVVAGGAELMTGSQAVGADCESGLWVETAERRLIRITGDALLLAPGARERFIPFKGWTLPGVISTGAAQLLLKTSGVLAARRMVAAGCGPLPMTCAAEVSAAGGRIQALLDATPVLRDPILLLRLAVYPSRMAEALKSLFQLIAAGARISPGSMVIEASGDDALREVVYARVDRRGMPVPGSEKKIRTGCLAVGHGFAPNLELPQAAGCRLAPDACGRGWIVEVDESMHTSVPGIYAAGEVTGIAGARKSFIEGRIAGLSIARDLGLEDARDFRSALDALRRSREREMRFGHFMGRLCIPPEGLWHNIPDETIICRCEDVTMEDLRRSTASGARTPGEVKRATRCGMGMCQGRTCGPIVNDFLSWRGSCGGPVEPLTVRIPVKPLSASAILDSSVESCSSGQ